MTDKFAEYYNNPDRISELSEYVHMNFKLICTKMISEMRKKLDITPDMDNSDGYVSLMVSLHGRLFNEMVYSTFGISQSVGFPINQILPPRTLMLLIDLLMDVNPLKGCMRKDVKDDLDGFKKYYMDHIDELRKCAEALPK